MLEIKYHHTSTIDPSTSFVQMDTLTTTKTVSTQQLLTEFYEHLLREEKSTATAAKYLRVVCTFLDYVKTEGDAANNTIADAEECILYVDAAEAEVNIPITCQTFISYKNMLTEHCAQFHDRRSELFASFFAHYRFPSEKPSYPASDIPLGIQGTDKCGIQPSAESCTGKCGKRRKLNNGWKACSTSVDLWYNWHPCIGTPSFYSGKCENREDYHSMQRKDS